MSTATTATAKSPKSWLVVVCDDRTNEPVCFLGELDKGLRQGVRKRENATRFTRVGATRVARAHSAHAMIVPADNRPLAFERVSSSAEPTLTGCDCGVRSLDAGDHAETCVVVDVTASSFVAELEYAGRVYGRTGKVGKLARRTLASGTIGEHTAEYADADDRRIWVNLHGEVVGVD